MPTPKVKGKATGDERASVEEAVDAYVEKQAEEKELEKLEKALEKDLAGLDDEESVLAGLADTPVQRVSNTMNEWIRLDNQRSQQAYQLRVARQAKDRDAIKSNAESLVRTRKRLTMVTLDVIKAVAEEEKVREFVPNWLQWPVNIRPLLKKHLKIQYKIDVSDIVEQVEEMERERDEIREMAGQDIS